MERRNLIENKKKDIMQNARSLDELEKVSGGSYIQFYP